MFTRYEGTNIPQNYSGSRFRSNEAPKEAVHSTQQMANAVKSSVSPTFENAISLSQELNRDIIFAPISDNDEDEPLSDEATTDVGDMEEVLDNEDISYSESEARSTPEKQPLDSPKSYLNQINTSSIGQFLKHLKSDDLLLISIIVILASEKALSSYDTIILLALLLVYHA